MASIQDAGCPFQNEATRRVKADAESPTAPKGLRAMQRGQGKVPFPGQERRASPLRPVRPAGRCLHAKDNQKPEAAAAGQAVAELLSGDIYSRVAARDQQTKTLRSTSSQGQVDTEPREDPSGRHGRALGILSSDSAALGHDVHVLPRASQTAPTTPSADPPLGLSWQQANRILHLYRGRRMSFFAFVPVAQDTNAEHLFATRPFLTRAIMLAAAPLPLPTLRTMRLEIMGYLSQHLLVANEVSLDTVQGLLVLIACGGVPFHDQSITHLTYLLLGCVYNLQMAQPCDQATEQISNFLDDPKKTNGAAVTPNIHSFGEQRVFLGCFFILSANSSCHARHNPLRGRHVDTTADALRAAREHPTDFFLERNVRMMQIEERLVDAFGDQNSGDSSKSYLFLVEGNARSVRAELDAILESVKNEMLEIDALRAPEHSPDALDYQHKRFKLHHSYILVKLYEPATQLQKLAQNGVLPGYHRSMYIRNCLVAAKTFFDTLFTLAPAEVLYESIVLMQYTMNVLAVTTRMLLMEAPDWDASLARLTVDFGGLADSLIDILEAAERLRRQGVDRFTQDTGIPTTAEEEQVAGPMYDVAKKLRWVKDWFEARIRGSSSAEWLAEDANGDFLREVQADMKALGGRQAGSAPVWWGGLLTDMDVDVDVGATQARV
ncbi:hypothetical protein S7711_03989 [Stachybotrys chartarum IBT 7711]|uniref:Transcription factor domain-containing protein n=1 Tax=Stachybotrys chartarum (strain CBS 109288 / IBT 7711) TaxID=1280523 RepID=A0A084AXE2_STACB|nr:hypothetical protein S7711_03989 [Stachybotrys chartarum IBT 7711]